MKNVFFLVGPTAVGKTGLAIDLAEKFEAEIVSADAFQIYRGLDTLTARPDAEAQRRVRQHLLSQISLAESMSAAKFRDLAHDALADIRSRGRDAIVVGGSGLYLKAITHGFDRVPPPDPKLRTKLSAFSTTQLAARLKKLNPELAARTDLKNPRRVIRAIEIVGDQTVIPSGVEGSGGETLQVTWRDPSIPLRSAQDDGIGTHDDSLIGVVLVRDRDDLYRRINERVEAMFRDGVEEEVRALSELGATAASALGLQEIQDLIAGQISRQECIAKIQQATRRYAKRQLTWFRHQTNFPQLNLTPLSHQEAVRAITQMLRRAEE